MAAPDTGALVASILNQCYLVRMYPRPTQRRQRARAIRALGLIVREAFTRSEDFEPLLGAIVDGLRPRDARPF